MLSITALVVPVAQQQSCQDPNAPPSPNPPAPQNPRPGPVRPPAPGGQLGQLSSTCDDRAASGTGAPYAFRATVDSTPGVTLTWNHEFGVNTPSSYRLERSADGGRSWTLIGDRFAGGWKDGGGAHHRLPGGPDYQSYLTAGGVYYYRVAAYVSPASGRGERLEYDCNVIGVRVR